MALLDEAESFFISHIRQGLRILLFLFGNSYMPAGRSIPIEPKMVEMLFMVAILYLVAMLFTSRPPPTVFPASR
eukprot:COSAG01_NODE_2160_length_8268_cov_230.522830_9_plen_74_part_00